jgi:hypothetical protein
MRTTHTSLALASAFAAMFLVAGCERQGPMERTGERMDETMEEAEDTLDPSGPGEEAGEKLDEAVDGD